MKTFVSILTTDVMIGMTGFSGQKCPEPLRRSGTNVQSNPEFLVSSGFSGRFVQIHVELRTNPTKTNLRLALLRDTTRGRQNKSTSRSTCWPESMKEDANHLYHMCCTMLTLWTVYLPKVYNVKEDSARSLEYSSIEQPGVRRFFKNNSFATVAAQPCLGCTFHTCYESLYLNFATMISMA